MRSLTFEKPVFNFSTFEVSYQLDYNDLLNDFNKTNVQNDFSPQMWQNKFKLT